MFTPPFKIAPYRIMRAIALGLSTGFLFTDFLAAQVIFVPVPVPVYRHPYCPQELNYQDYRNIDYWVRRLDSNHAV